MTFPLLMQRSRLIDCICDGKVKLLIEKFRFTTSRYNTSRISLRSCCLFLLIIKIKGHFFIKEIYHPFINIILNIAEAIGKLYIDIVYTHTEYLTFRFHSNKTSTADNL